MILHDVFFAMAVISPVFNYMIQYFIDFIENILFSNVWVNKEN